MTSPSEGEVDNWVDVSQYTQFLFSVRACSDACVELYSSSSHTIRPSYRVCLGEKNNTETSIRISNDAGLEIATSFATTPEMIHCVMYRHFWISWNNGNVSIGRGHRGKYLLLHLQDPDWEVRATIKSLHLASRALKHSVADFQFNYHAGKEILG